MNSAEPILVSVQETFGNSSQDFTEFNEKRPQNSDLLVLCLNRGHLTEISELGITPENKSREVMRTEKRQIRAHAVVACFWIARCFDLATRKFRVAPFPEPEKQ
jgi:hypothetical protein